MEPIEHKALFMLLLMFMLYFRVKYNLMVSGSIRNAFGD